MKVVRRVLCVLYCVLSYIYIYSQDPVYSQFYNAPTELNPAFAGISYAPVFSINYRNQWPGISNAYQTYSASYNQFIDNFNSGVGFSILADNAGDGALQTLKIAGQYAYSVPLREDVFMKIGIEFAAINSRLNWEKLSFPDQIDPEFGSISPGGTPFPTGEVQPDALSNTFLDLSTGLLLYNNKFYFGASAKHINGSRNSFIDATFLESLPLRVSLHAGYQIDLPGGNKRNSLAFITPNVLYTKQADFSQLIAGAYLGLRSLFIGSWYRHSWSNPDAIIASLGVKSKAYKIMYSYDFTISELSLSSGGSHELGILIQLEEVYPKKSKLNDCLSLFR